MRLSNESVVLKVFGKEHVLKKAQVVRLEYFRGWVSRGVKIVHCCPEIDPHVVFWSFAPACLLATAEKSGYETVAERA